MSNFNAQFQRIPMYTKMLLFIQLPPSEQATWLFKVVKYDDT